MEHPQSWDEVDEYIRFYSDGYIDAAVDTGFCPPLQDRHASQQRDDARSACRAAMEHMMAAAMARHLEAALGESLPQFDVLGGPEEE